ncbi:UNVERIFIED_CONTAM: hypothetical protein FKN15_052321 [Acipenser sinensis]
MISLPTGEDAGEEEQAEPRCATSQTRSGSAVAITHWLTVVALADQWRRDGEYKRGLGPGFCSFWQAINALVLYKEYSGNTITWRDFILQLALELQQKHFDKPVGKCPSTFSQRYAHWHME